MCGAGIMEHNLTQCRYVEFYYCGTLYKFGLEIFPIMTATTFRISVYSDCKITLSDKIILETLCYAFQEIAELKDNIEVSKSALYSRTRNSIEINVSKKLFNKVYLHYLKMNKVYAYKDKLFMNVDFLKCFKIKSKLGLELTIGNIKYMNSNDVNLFFNGTLIDLKSDIDLVWKNLYRNCNYVGIYLND